MKHSAGILAYKVENEQLKVLLCHMGGPYWQKIDKSGWSIPKGEFKKEKAIDAAVREFKEETGFNIDGNKLEFLGSKKQSNNKLITIFISMCDFDTTKAVSNTFSMEWPKGSGIIQEFPEMNKAEWLNIQEAKLKILKGQVDFLSKLEQKLGIISERIKK